MRPSLLVPGRETTSEIVQATLALAGVHLRLEAIEPWTELELVLAYDWAIRVHLAASDNAIKQRPKPAFVEAAEKAEASRPVIAAAPGQGPHIHQALREFLCHRGQAGASLRLIIASLDASGMYPSPDLLERWLEADERDDLVARIDGRWRATEKMAPMLYLSERFPPEEERPAPRFPDREHLVSLNARDAARLRAWLARPNGSLSCGRVVFEAVSGGGILVRTRPVQVDERLCDRVLTLLRGAGMIGLSPVRIAANTGTSRTAVMAALRALRAAGEAENHAFGVWRSTVRQPLHALDYEEGLGW